MSVGARLHQTILRAISTCTNLGPTLERFASMSAGQIWLARAWNTVTVVGVRSGLVQVVSERQRRSLVSLASGLKLFEHARQKVMQNGTHCKFCLSRSVRRLYKFAICRASCTRS